MTDAPANEAVAAADASSVPNEGLTRPRGRGILKSVGLGELFLCRGQGAGFRVLVGVVTRERRQPRIIPCRYDASMNNKIAQADNHSNLRNFENL